MFDTHLHIFVYILDSSECIRTKEGGLLRELALALSLQFTHAQFFASHAHSQRVHSAATDPLTTALYTTGGVRELYCLHSGR